MYVVMYVQNTYNEIYKRDWKSMEASTMKTRMEKLLERKRCVAETQVAESERSPTVTRAAAELWAATSARKLCQRDP